MNLRNKAFIAHLYDTKELVIAFSMGAILSGIFTIRIMVVHDMWFTNGILFKILSVVPGGFIAILIAIMIHPTYELFVFNKKRV